MRKFVPDPITHKAPDMSVTDPSSISITGGDVLNPSISAFSIATRDLAVQAAVRRFIRTIKYRDGILVDDFLYDTHKYFVTLVMHVPDGIYGQAGSVTFVSQMDRLKGDLQDEIFKNLRVRQVDDDLPRLYMHCIYHTNWLFIRDREAGGSDDA